jgi:phosphate transport system permease protein
MTAVLEESPSPAFEPDDVPRSLGKTRDGADWAFQISARAIGTVVLLVTGGIGVFLGYQMIPTLHHYGLHFFSERMWNPENNVVGISSVVVGTLTVAIIALMISFPLALFTALYITEYSPPRLRGYFVAAVDLMAAVPSIIYGLWGLLLIEPHALFLARFLNEYFGWVPFLHVDIPGSSPSAPSFEQHDFESSAFVAGLVVSMMVIPMGCAVMRGVFAQTPIGEREAAYALGATKWGMIRAVVLPFGRGGIIGGTMLALGRALGETIAVVLIVSPDYLLKLRPLESGTQTIAWLIATDFGDASNIQLSALLAAGFVLFVMTLIVNTLAAIIVNRSRSGAGTDI